MQFQCAYGCGQVAEEACETSSTTRIPPNGWVTLSVNVSSPEPPYMTRDGRYSAVLCSIDCAIAFLNRQRRIMQFSVASGALSGESLAREETRSDIAHRIGALVLEAVDEMSDHEEDGRTVLLPLLENDFSLSKDVALAFLPLTSEMKNAAQELS